MLELRDITKNYELGGANVEALKGVSIAFRSNEFVAILGHSGCGKTTLLNIVGGLDHYTSGDLIINNISTKKYNDKDWDAYRNHSVGFVFQSYNLIPHQTVLSNVELALTISGVSKAERRKRAIEALEKVGLGDQLNKKPNQMSGGQMQRVAIARALVNNPDILLADEPTGALDSDTSVQIMDILKEIAKEKLVIMVTHNPELAAEYANRIVRIKDGLLTSDSNPYEPSAQEAIVKKSKHVSMSLKTAFSLSLNNLMTKKGRTFMTAFAGSIGIIGIALILSLSNGINTYINKVQEDTLSSYPISIDAETTDTGNLINSMMEINVQKMENLHDYDKVYSNTIMYDMLNSMSNASLTKNNLKAFKEFLDSNEELKKYVTEIQYIYESNLPIYTEDTTGKIIKTDFVEIMGEAMGTGSEAMMNSQYSMFSTMKIFDEFLSDKDGNISDMVTSQYEVVHGSWPKAYNEVVLIVDRNNEISDLMLYCLGLKDTAELPALIASAMNGDAIENVAVESWTYEEICGKEFKLVLPTEHYIYNEELGHYVDTSLTDEGLKYLYNNDEIGVNLKITGIIKPTEDATMLSSSAFGYTHSLTQYVLEQVTTSEVIAAQLESTDMDVLTGLPFRGDNFIEKTSEEKAASFKEYMSALGSSSSQENALLLNTIYAFLFCTPDEAYISSYIDNMLANSDRATLETQIAQMYAQSMGVSADSVMSYISAMSDEELYAQITEALTAQVIAEYAQTQQATLASMSQEELAMTLASATFTDYQYATAFDQFTPDEYSETTYDDNLKLLGYITEESPTQINIYTSTFNDKEEISAIIEKYNNSQSDEDNKITYTDYVALLMSSMTGIISGVSYLLIAFVGIALVVSSIMIGIITYISVLERTREIGILRAIGASKRDISNVFNAETMLIGFTAGAIGIIVTLILNIPISMIIQHLTDLEINSTLPVAGGIILVLISVFLTFIAGLIPSSVAAKKDPVTALRTE